MSALVQGLNVLQENLSHEFDTFDIFNSVGFSLPRLPVLVLALGWGGKNKNLDSRAPHENDGGQILVSVSEFKAPHSPLSLSKGGELCLA